MMAHSAITALIKSAIKHESIQTIAHCLGNGLNIDSTDQNGQTLLHLAILAKSEIVTEYLLDNGANPELCNNAGLNSFALAEISNFQPGRLSQIQKSVNTDCWEEVDSIWISEEPTEIPKSDVNIEKQVKEITTIIEVWTAVDCDEKWEDIEIELPIFEDTARCAWLTAILSSFTIELEKSPEFSCEYIRTIAKANAEFFSNADEAFHKLSFIAETLGAEIVEDTTVMNEFNIHQLAEVNHDLLEFSSTIISRKYSAYYLLVKSLGESSTISREMENELFAEYKNSNDINIRNKLIASNIKFAYKIAMQGCYPMRAIGAEDIIAEAFRGLIIAAERFDVNEGVKFITYAVWWIRQRVQKYHYDHERCIRIPSNKLRLLKKYKVALDKDPNTGWDINNDSELEELRDELPMLAAISDEISVDSYDNLEEIPLDDWAIAEFETPESALYESEIIEKINALVLPILDDRSETVIRMYYAIGYEKEHTYEEIGNILTVSRERVRQIHNKALDKLRINSLSRSVLLDML